MSNVLVQQADITKFYLVFNYYFFKKYIKITFTKSIEPTYVLYLI